MIGRPTNVGYASQAHRAKRRSRQDLNLRPTDPQSVALSTELRDHMTVFVIESIPVHATCVKYSRAKGCGSFFCTRKGGDRIQEKQAGEKREHESQEEQTRA